MRNKRNEETLEMEKENLSQINGKLENKEEFRISSGLLVRNSVFNFLGQLVPLFIGFFTIPFLIRGLGIERFGILSIAWIVVGYFSFFDLGLGRATTKFIAEALGKKETEELPHLIWTSLAIHLLLGLIGCLILAFLIPFLTDIIFNIPTFLAAETKRSFLILAISLPIILASSSLRGVLEAKQRFDLVNAVNIAANSLIFLLPALGVFLGFGLFKILLLLMITRLGSALAYFILCQKIFLFVKDGLCFDFKLIGPMFGFGGWITVSNVVGPLSAYFDRIIIGSVLTMASVAYYAAPYEIVIRLWIIPSSMVMTLFPAFSAMEATSKDNMKTLFVRANKYVLMGVGPIALGIAIFANEILQLWLGNDFAKQSTIPLQILAISTLIGCMAPVSGGLIQGLGRPDIISKVYLLYFFPNMALIWLLIQKLGITGASLSFAIRILIDTSIFFIISLRLINLSITSFLEKDFLRYGCLLIMFGIILLIISHTIAGLFTQVFFVVITIFILCLFTWHWALDSADKKILSSAANQMFLNKNKI